MFELFQALAVLWVFQALEGFREQAAFQALAVSWVFQVSEDLQGQVVFQSLRQNFLASLNYLFRYVV